MYGNEVTENKFMMYYCLSLNDTIFFRAEFRSNQESFSFAFLEAHEEQFPKSHRFITGNQNSLCMFSKRSILPETALLSK